VAKEAIDMGGRPVYSEMTGVEFKAIRNRLGLSSKEMSELLGLRTYNTITQWEKGRVPIQMTHARLVLAINHSVDVVAVFAPVIYNNIVCHLANAKLAQPVQN
jgi:transcriptional regulator with XRE-family HTH domain